MTEIIGYIAALLTTISFLPQVIKTIKTKDTEGISLSMYLLFVTGIVLWLIYGFSISNMVIILANTLTLALSSIVLYYKIKATLSSENSIKGSNYT